MKRLAVSVSCCLFAACSSAQNHVELAGQRFCVPESHVAPGVPWVKPDGKAVRDSKGIAVSNCLTARTSANALIKSECLFPPAVGTIVIDEDDGFRIKPSDLVGRIATEEGAVQTVVDDRRLLVTENQKIWRDWYVWYRKGSPFSLGDQPNAGDELLVTCHKSRSRIGASPSQMRNVFVCDRQSVLNGLSISYSFESESKVPSFDAVARLDKKLIDGLSKIRCD